MPLYVTEYDRLGRASDGPYVAAGLMPPIAEQVLTVEVTSAPSSAFNAATGFVMVHTSQVCHLAFGPAPVAADTAHRMAAGETRYYGVSPGHKIAVVQGV